MTIPELFEYFSEKIPSQKIKSFLDKGVATLPYFDNSIMDILDIFGHFY